MSLNRNTRALLIALAVTSALAMGALAGCSSSSTTTATTPVPAASSAMSAAKVAVSTLSTTAPDGRILVAQSASAITATSTPSWQFLIGSPKSDKLYAVMVANGKGQWQEYGTAGLTAAEWKLVPAFTDWKIDSTEAHAKAVAVHASAKTAPYVLGFVTYIPKTAGKTNTQPMVWYVSFDPAAQGKAPTSTVDVNMVTGAAAFAK